MSSLSNHGHTCTVGNDEHGHLYGYSSESDDGYSSESEQVYPEFAQLLKDKLKDETDVSQTLCVSVLHKGREAIPDDEHNHINFLVSQDPNFDLEDIGGCPHGKTPVMVDWEKPWYLRHIYDWTCNNGDPPRLCDPKTEEYPKRYCPCHMDQKLLEQFYTEFDCGIEVTDIEERFLLKTYEWTSEPRGFDADCRLVRVPEELLKKKQQLKQMVEENNKEKAAIKEEEGKIKKRRASAAAFEQEKSTKKQKLDADGSAKEPLTGVALWKDKLWETIFNGYGRDVHLADVMELLNEAKEAKFPIDVDGLLMENDDMNVLNTILYHSFFEHDEEDINDLKKLLLQSKNWKRYWFDQEKVFHSPLGWIDWTDEEAAIKILPFFKEHGHVIDNRERKNIGEKVLAAWDKLNNMDPE